MQGRCSTRLAIAMMLAAGTAMAQPAPDQAEQAYREGRRHYDLREWDDAIAQFKIAYRLRSDAASLFNIAQSYRLKGDCVSASSFYKTYRRNFPTAPNLAKVDKFITELEPCAKERSTPPVPPPPGPPPSSGTTQPTQEPNGTVPVVVGMPGATSSQAPSGQDPTGPGMAPIGPVGPVGPLDDPGAHTRRTGLIFLGAGAIVVGAGVVFGVQAMAKSSDVERGSGTWDPRLEDEGKRDQALAIGLVIGGGAAVVAGSVLYYVGLSHQLSHVSVTPRTGGAEVVWSSAF